MAISGFLFISWRLAEVFTLIPTVGMLAWFVHGYTESNMLTPNTILVLFIVSTLALAWALFTLIGYFSARRSGMFLALVDLLFVGAFIAGVYYLRGITNADCSHFARQSSSIYLNLGVFGNYGAQADSPWALHVNKNCAMLKASFAFGIMNIIFFFITFLLALLVARHHKSETVVVTRHSSRHGHRRSTSREYASSPRRSHHSHRSRRSYYV